MRDGRNPGDSRYTFHESIHVCADVALSATAGAALPDPTFHESIQVCADLALSPSSRSDLRQMRNVEHAQLCTLEIELPFLLVVGDAAGADLPQWRAAVLADMAGGDRGLVELGVAAPDADHLQRGKLNLLIEECWSHEPKMRPNFDDVVKRLNGEIADEIRRKEEPTIVFLHKLNDSIYHKRMEDSGVVARAASEDSSDDEKLVTTLYVSKYRWGSGWKR